MPLPGLQHVSVLSQMHTGLPLQRDIAQPFLDLEKDRNRNLAARMFAAPAGALAMHTPILPSAVAPEAAAQGASMISPASALIEHAGMNAPWASTAGDFASTIAGHMSPILAMGILGGMGGLGAAAGVGKLWNMMAKRRAAKRNASSLAQMRM